MDLVRVRSDAVDGLMESLQLNDELTNCLCLFQERTHLLIYLVTPFRCGEQKDETARGRADKHAHEAHAHHEKPGAPKAYDCPNDSADQGAFEEHGA